MLEFIYYQNIITDRELDSIIRYTEENEMNEINN